MNAPEAPGGAARRAGIVLTAFLAGALASAVVLWPREPDARREPPPEPAPAAGRGAKAEPTPGGRQPGPAPVPLPVPDAHAGSRAFTGEVPEAISLIRFDMVRTIERARERRWFDDPEAYGLAQAALARAQDYAARLETDRLHRAFDGAIRSVAADPDLRTQGFDAAFAPPYVICMARGPEDADASDAVFETAAVRGARLAAYGERAARRARILGDLGSVLTQVYAEFMKRHAERAGLRDLLGAFGGRPDLPISKRSFRDGCPLVVWLSEARDPEFGADFAGVEWPAGRLRVIRSAAIGERVDREVEEAARQLLLWFRRQRNEWGAPRDPETFFDAGFPAMWSGVVAGAGGRLDWRAEGPWIDPIRESARDRGGRPFLFPLEEFVDLEGRESLRFAQRERVGGPNPSVALFRSQSAALLTFLRDGNGASRRAAYEDFVAERIGGPRLDGDHPGRRGFAQAFGLRTDADWKALDAEFRAFVEGLLAAPAVRTVPPAPPEPGRVDRRPEVFGVSAPR